MDPRWVEEDLLIKREEEEFKPYEAVSFKSHFVKKMTDNLFVPLGLVATVACLTMGLVNLSRGDSKRQQFYMRGRVIFQGFTLVAMTSGLLLTAYNKRKN